MFLTNGCEQNILVTSDRATQFGDGCFTTACITNGEIPLLAAHFKRLQDACQKLLISSEDRSKLQNEVRMLAGGRVRGVLKIIISRDSGGRGYSGENCHSITRILSVSAWSNHHDRWRQEGTALALSSVRLGRNPLLTGLKHLNQLEQASIRSHLEQTDADEAPVVDSEGWAIECCTAGLFWRKGDAVYTPRLGQTGMNSIMRQFCTRMLA